MSAESAAVLPEVGGLPHRTGFVHLRVQSSFSLLESMLRLGEIVRWAREEAAMPALGLCDRNNMFGALEFSERCALAGLQPIIGATLSLAPMAGLQKPTSLALLVQDDTGYGNLLHLVSAAHLQAGTTPCVPWELLLQHHAGLIVLTGGPDGPLHALLEQNQPDAARAQLDMLGKTFATRCYVELQRYTRAQDAPRLQRLEAQLVALAYDQNLPLVATNQALFEKEEDFPALDALTCIAQGKTVRDTQRIRANLDQYLKSPDTMRALFADVPEAVANSVVIAQRCHFRPRKRAPMLPRFVDGDEGDVLRAKAQTGLAERIKTYEARPNGLAAKPSVYEERLAYELDSIIAHEYAGYFLIVADFIQWAKTKRIAVGPGRGSGAGSLVAWVLGITELDPLRFGLLFERFLNPARASMPDFDIDFCQIRRDEVIEYVRNKYGEARVAQIITFGTMQARGVLRDVGRVLGLPYAQVDRLCKMVPFSPPVGDTDETDKPIRPLAQALQNEPRLKAEIDSEPALQQMMQIAFKLEGLERHASTHAAGVVVSRAPLTTLVPLYRDVRAPLPATQFNMKWAEAAGLVKFDFLGLKTLSILQRGEELLRAQNISCDIASIPLDDTAGFALLAAGDTFGVFQLESAGMRDVLRAMRPDSFEDIIALVALYRPGPMDNIPTYIACKRGEKPVDILHDSLTPILEETYGVMIYQEQVMQIAQRLAGYTLADADLLRRAMSKKKKSEMELQRQRFVQGARDNQIDAKTATHVFEQVSKFAGYGFNKSHAAAYALVAWQTAWLKANHQLVFYAASMSYDLYDTDRLQAFWHDALAHDIDIVPPDVNHSDVAFLPRNDKLIYALAAIRNVGRSAMQALVEERTANGPFTDIWDFARRAGAWLNRRLLESLIKAGALDCLEPNRARLLAACDTLLAEAQAAAQPQARQQDSLFDDTTLVSTNPDLPECSAWTPAERLAHELEAIGFYLSGHPLDVHKDALKAKGVQPYAQFANTMDADSWLAGCVVKLQRRRSKRGTPYAFLTLSDMSGEYELMLFSAALNDAQAYLEVGELVVAHVRRDAREGAGGAGRLQASMVRPLTGFLGMVPDRPAPVAQQRLRIFVSQSEALRELHTQLTPHFAKTGADISLVVADNGQETELQLPGQYKLSRRHVQAIKMIAGVTHIEDLE